ncbi:hypothetical protein ColLi_09466 [Colletotrichum liriopes]|uniref:Uncharacterized protein n=1 Tax=Colletotrichum liriopes TaxID=708192 RepID=A0AA37GSV5_9PEZI|nr:hypothetical protein ColLi_09466 [Colletotrichum liriopes]
MPRRLNNHTASAPLYKAAKHRPTNRQTLLGHLPFPLRPSSSSPYRPRIPPILLPVDRPAQRAVVERDAPPQQHPEDLRPPRPPYDLLVAHDPADLVPEEAPERVRLGVVLEPGRARPAAGPRLGTVISGGHVFPQDLLEAVHAHPERQPLRLGPVDQPNQPAGPLPHPPPPPSSPPSRLVAVLARRMDQDVVRHQVPALGQDLQPPPQTPADLPLDNVPPVPPAPPGVREHDGQVRDDPPPARPRVHPQRRGQPPELRQRDAAHSFQHVRTQLPVAAPPRACRLQARQHAQLLDAGHGPAAEHAPRLRAEPDVDAVPPRPELHQQAAPLSTPAGKPFALPPEPSSPLLLRSPPPPPLPSSASTPLSRRLPPGVGGRTSSVYEQYPWNGAGATSHPGNLAPAKPCAAATAEACSPHRARNAATLSSSPPSPASEADETAGPAPVLVSRAPIEIIRINRHCLFTAGSNVPW